MGWLEGGWFIVIKRGAPPSGVPSRQVLGLPYPAQLSGAARERTRLRDIHGELQLSWSGVRRAAAVSGRSMVSGRRVAAPWICNLASELVHVRANPRRSRNDISTILQFSPRPCSEETSPWSMSYCMPVKDDTKSTSPSGDVLVPHICGGSCLSPRWIIGGVVGMWCGEGSIPSFLVNHSYGPLSRATLLQEPLEHHAPRLPLLLTPAQL